MKKIVLLVFTVLLFVECSTVPITGRKRVNFVSDSQVLPASFAQYKGFLAENKLSNNRKMTYQIKEVGKNISAAVDRFMRANNMVAEANSYKWEFNLIEDKTVNAWCMPGGKIVFYTGILPIAKSETGVAAIMGHEVAHALANHGQQRQSASYVQQGIAIAGNVAIKDEESRNAFNQYYGIGSQVGITGTPAFVIGEELVPGALDVNSLKEKIKALR